jgi:hypothetical protein
MRSIPAQISTACRQLNDVWSRYARHVFNNPGVLIADTGDALNWHAFLGHTLDMQEFKAAEFAGADPLSRLTRKGFTSLKDRSLGVVELAALWDIEPVSKHLLAVTAFGAKNSMMVTYEVLRRSGGRDGQALAEALETFPYKKQHKFVRAYLQNSAKLQDDGYSFRNWLITTCAKLGVPDFPPANFRKRVAFGHLELPLERALRACLEQTFYLVGPAMAAYTLCDWQLGPWKDGKTDYFQSFKVDAFHQKFAQKYISGIQSDSEDEFATWWASFHPDLPPRLANECIWIGISQGIV